jgi:hypothetical protein
MLSREHKLIIFTCTRCGKQHEHGKDLRCQQRILPVNQVKTSCAFCGKVCNVEHARVLLKSYSQQDLRCAYARYAKEYVI